MTVEDIMDRLEIVDPDISQIVDKILKLSNKTK